MSTRRVLLLVGILAILGVGGYAAYRLGYFARDAEDTAEIAKLNARQLEVSPLPDSAGAAVGWRGVSHDGRVNAAKLRTDWDKNPPKLLWKADTLGGKSSPLGGGYSSPVVVGGSLYIQDYRDGKERVLCLDADSGEYKWECSFPANYSGTDATYAIGPRATPSIDGELIYTVSGAGTLLCIEKQADKPAAIKWQHELLKEFEGTIPRWGVACSPLLEGELVLAITGGKAGSVVAFDKKSGEVQWRAGKNPAGYSSPVAATIGGQRVIFALTGDALLAIRPSDGKVTDEYAWKTDNYGNIATPLVVDDYVFISSAYQKGCALLRAEAKGDEVRFVQVYARLGRAFQNHHSTSVYKNHHLFGFDGMIGGARLKCVDFNTGKVKEDWEATGMALGSGTILLADKYMIIQTEGGDLCLAEANPEEFHLVTRMKKVLSGNNNWATPALADGRLYLRDEQKVLCYDVRP
jgi:outer membrane protein assembly factor BamB